MAIFYDEYLNEGARTKYLDKKQKEYKELDDYIRKNDYDNELANKREKVADQILKYGGSLGDYKNLSIKKAKIFDNGEKASNSEGYRYRNPYKYRNKSAMGKEEFMKDFEGPSRSNPKKYETAHADFPEVAMNLNKKAIKSKMAAKNKLKSMKEACEYILSVIDESYDYDDYDDEY